MVFKKENYQIKSNSMGFYQDLEHIDGMGISAISANLYENKKRDDLVLFYFRKGATYASVYTQSNIKSENIKWNINNSKDKVFALLVNTRNANAFTGKEGYKSINNIAVLLSELLSKKQIKDEEEPKKIKIRNILFASTLLPEKSRASLPEPSIVTSSIYPLEKSKSIASKFIFSISMFLIKKSDEIIFKKSSPVFSLN